MNKSSQIIVAVDGYSSTGKSTISKIVAFEMGLTYIDTGAMYRAVTYYAMTKGMFVEGNYLDKDTLKKELKNIDINFTYKDGIWLTNLNGVCVENEIRSMDVANHVSAIAIIDFVRSFLVDKQREMGLRGSVIMDGRDIGSVVFPDADIKFFMTCLPKIRAERRYKELIDNGEDISYDEVEANIIKRDYIDENRDESPLLCCDDAIIIDSTDLNISDVVNIMVNNINRVLKNDEN